MMITIRDNTSDKTISCRNEEVAQALLESGWFLNPSDEIREAIAEYGVRVAAGANAINYEAYLCVQVM